MSDVETSVCPLELAAALDADDESEAGPLLVLADTYQLACHYAQEHDLGRPGERWRYVDEARTVRGMRGPGRYVLITLPGARITPRLLAERAFALDYLRSHGFVSAS